MNRLHSRTSRLLLGVLTLLTAIALAAPAPALAFTGVEGGSLYISQNIGDDLYIGGNIIDISGTVDGDVFAAGQAITISGTVNGTVYAAAQTISISGEVKGSVMAAAQTVRVTGVVGGSVRSAGQDVLIDGTVGKDLLAAGATVTIAPTGSVGRDALVGSSSFNARGPVGRNIDSSSSDVTIASTVGGDVSVTAPKVNIIGGAVIGGDLTYFSDKNATITGRVAGETIHKPAPVSNQPTTKPSPGKTLSLALLAWVRAIIASMLVALIAIFIFRGFTEKSTDCLSEDPWKSLKIGILAAFLVFPVVMTVFIAGLIIGGWAIAFTISSFYIVVVHIGIIVGAYAAGRWLFKRLGIRNTHPLLAILAVIVIVETVSLVPFVGWLLGTALYLFGSGAVLLELTARTKQDNAPYKKIAAHVDGTGAPVARVMVPAEPLVETPVETTDVVE